MSKIRLLFILNFTFIIMSILLSLWTYNHISTEGEEYRNNIIYLEERLNEAESIYSSMLSSSIDKRYLLISSEVFGIYNTNVDLGNFNTKKLTNLVSSINEVTKSNEKEDVEEVVVLINELQNEIISIKKQINSDSNLKWYFALS